MKLTLTVTVVASLAGAPALRADAVPEWSVIAQGSIVGTARIFPGEAAVYMGIVHVAMYDAAVAVAGGYRPYHVSPAVPPGASLDAAVATAAHHVLVGLFPAQRAALDAAYASSLAGVPDGPAKSDGIAAGEEVASGILALPTDEGLKNTVPYVQPAPGPGVFEPTAAAAPLGTRLPLVVPLALEFGSRFRPAPPLPLASEEYTSDFDDVREQGALDSPVRTEEQTRIALFWTDHDIPQWNRNLVRLAAEVGLGPVETSRMLAMAHVAGSDAMIGCFDAKYHYMSWRPVHAIRRADTDGNPLTEPDPAWQPLRGTPNHPEYPSAHACHSAAIAEALETAFGGNVPFSLDSLVTGETRRYDRFKDVVQEVNRARVYAGFHFRNSDQVGATLGRKVGRYVVENFFQPVE